MTADVSVAPPIRRSPLGATTDGPYRLAAAPGVELLERPFLVHLNLRLSPTDAALDAVEAAIGVRPSVTPNRRTAGDNGRGMAWLGPDEWLLVAPGDGGTLGAELEVAVRPHGGSVVDLSAHRTTLEIHGPRSREILASACSIDLHPRSFEIAHCAQTTLARVDVVIGRVGDDAYRIYVRASFAPYLVAWLRDAIGAVAPDTGAASSIR